VTEKTAAPTNPPSLDVNTVISPIITYVIVATVAIIIAIAIVGILLLRRKA
jgi:hypothetical protein